MATVLDVIEDGKWTQALFTTFALSLSFFESIFLRALRQGGCQEIWVISDAQGYNASLIERKSTAVGQDYRLLPVRLSKGVFHPKCVYLAGPDEDALVIGSGNLTFGGFGRNLEVLEVFSSKDSPSLFTQFADFLGLIRSRSDLECPDKNWCTKFEVRARTAGATGNGQPSIRLLHSAAFPVLDQLREAVTDAEEMTVMSPFFDEDGFAIRTTADRLGCKRIRIAVPPKTAAFNFPFLHAKRWPQAVEAVWPDKQDGKRSVHAKWLEFKSRRAKSVLTGSANATRQALCTTNNIEVSVLRIGPPQETWAEWIPSQPPTSFVPTAYSSPALSGLIAHATLSGAVLDGAVLGANVPSGKWQCALTRTNGDIKRFGVEIHDGRFHAVESSLTDFSFSSGLQISLTFGERTARGWVHVEDVLRMTRLPKLNIGAVLRIIARENTEDDDVALLEYLAINAHKHLPTFIRKINAVGESSHETNATSIIAVDLEELAPTPTPTNTAASGTDLAELSLERVFAQLRKRLLGHGAQKNERIESPSSFEPETDSVDASDADTEEDAQITWAQPPQRIQTALDEFHHEMRTLLDAPDLDELNARGLLVLWFEVAMNMLLVRKGDFSGALRFAREWINIFARKIHARPEIDSAEQHFVTSIAFLATSAAVDELVEFHELLESFYTGSVDQSRVAAAILPATAIPFRMLCNADSLAIQQALLATLKSSTLRQQVIAVVEAAKRGQPVPEDSQVFRGDAGELIRAQLQSTSGKARFKEQIADKLVCANCYTTLPAVMAAHLSSRRIAWHCGWFTVRTR